MEMNNLKIRFESREKELEKENKSRLDLIHEK
jgi:hypothetical protein